MKKHLFFLILLLLGSIGVRAAGPSGTLPVIYINIDNGAEVVTKEPYLNAVYWLDPKGTDGIEAIGSEEAPLKTKIKGRGNYTFTGFEKKPYRLKLDKKAALCGLKSSKHWGLLAHADDNRGFLRNAIGFKASELVGLPWTPKQYPVELVVNGTYRGLYFLTQIIRIDSDRVNITKWVEEDENGVALDKWIEGGTLVELDNYEEPAQIQFYNPGSPEPLRFTYDKSVDPGFEPDGYINWLKQSLGKVNDLILNGSRTSDELWQYVDIDDLARFITVQEFMDNYESFHGSCYIYREKGDNEKWHFSPVWDFGSAFQRNHPDHSCFLMQSGNMHYNHWVNELLEFPALREKIAQYWAVLKGERSAIDTFADSYIAQITRAAAADRERWPQYGNDNLNGKLNEVKGFMNNSSNYMNRNFSVQPVDEIPFYLCGSFNGWTLAEERYKFTQNCNVYT
ncbi:MAG: CotH kinase family protein, partial [Muribaculaceae bacterium]|nr:CotH kinase family protein [Muribaculaceae bacterium]